MGERQPLIVQRVASIRRSFLDDRNCPCANSIHILKKMVKTNGWQQFLMLLYKGMLLRKRHYIVTALEVLIPLVAASMILIGLEAQSKYHNVEYDTPLNEDRNNHAATWKNGTIYPPVDPYKTDTYGYSKSITFLYAPDSGIAIDLMETAINLWKQKTGFREDIIRKPLPTEEDIISFALTPGNSKNSELIGTVLNNFNSKVLPESLDYKIRYIGRFGFYGSFSTDQKFRINGPQTSNPYTQSYFLSWQAAVEESFIANTTGYPYELMMQRFPYPDHIDTSNQNFLIAIIPWVLCYGFLIFTIVLVRRVTEEKSNGSKELLKMMGMTDFVYWLGTFVNYFIVGAVLTLIICILYKVPIKTNAIMLPQTNFLLLMILLWLLMATQILFSFVVTTFVPHRIFSGVVLTILTVVSLTMLTKDIFLPGDTLKYFLISQSSKLGLCLFPVGAAFTIFSLISTFEANDEGATWSNLTQYGVSADINMLMVMGMMLVSCFLYAVVIWYIDAVWPWQYGVPKPFYFPFTKSYWCSNGYQPIEDENSGSSSHDSEFFEDEPTGSTPGVVIRNLVKSFRTGTRSKVAVNNVSLNVYNGQITALLGHNGAGKTTTINILTGLFPPSNGSASINGWDILTQTTNARRSLGVCPQHNILYDTLTPDEHLRFYAGLKGVRWGNFSTESTKLLNMLHLYEKRNELVKTLSGGMKRKLSLAIALIGDSKVLFLDEPTSGMDPEARRSVWDALLDIRKDCTIILTTHYMEEADILGDRIAIMADGEIQCCGSSIFLKKKLGTGYKLHIVKNVNFNLHGIEEVLHSYIPEASVESDQDKEVTFSLSCNTDTSLGEMFEKLEFSKTEFGITSYGISVTTMEDVFVNAAKIAELRHKPKANLTEHELTSNGEDRYSGEKNLLKSHLLAFNQLAALLVKRFHCAKRTWLVYIIQVALPLVIMCILLLTLRRAPLSNVTYYPALKMDLENVYGKTKGFYHSSEIPAAKSFAENHFKQILEQNQVTFPADKPDFDLQQYVLNFGKNDLAGYLKTLMIGGSMDYTDTLKLTSWYNGEPWHTMPISLNLMNNAILKATYPKSRISLMNAPLPYVSENDYGNNPYEVVLAQILSSVLVPLSLSFLVASYCMFPVEERASKSKLLQLMAGLPSWLYWCGMFIWDAVFHILICVLLLIPFAAFDSSMYYSHSDIIGSIFLLLLLYGWCSIPFCYVISFMFKKPNTAFQVVLIIFMLTGMVLSSVMTAVSSFSQGMEKDLPSEIVILMWVFKVFPSFSIANGMSHIFGIAFTRSRCNGLSEKKLHDICVPGSHFDPDVICCAGSKSSIYNSPLGWGFDKAGREALFLFFEGVLFFMLVLFLETTILKTFWRFLKRKMALAIKRIRPSTIEMLIRDTVEEDSEVSLEEQRVEDLCLRKSFGEESLMVHNLTKVYKNLYAVDNLTFGVHHEECFGLLGVNGAGKTTTFKMITGDVLPSQGNAYIQDTNLIQNREKFQSFIGYCPQYDALLDKLTGKETLNLFAKLRGLAGTNMELSVNQLIRMVDLQEHADKLTSNYSGGNKRKLSLAIALIGAPPLILLDEPTSGVDPVSRRKIWKVLMQARSNAGCAIILTTHSMEESEALCNRLAIMVNGKFRCLGSLQQLKTKYGRGFTVIMKLKKEELNKPNAMIAEKAYFRNGFPNAILTDDHQSMLQYHITDTSVPLSHLFKFMDEMKRQFNLGDYLISGTSLEQIFLAFARAQRPSTVEYV